MARQSTLNVSLTSTLRNYVKSKLRSGRYESASEVIREGLRALQERERFAQSFWTGVQQKVAVARQHVAQGKMVDGEAAMDQILAELSHDREPPKRKNAGQ